jgi:hypothetical protein
MVSTTRTYSSTLHSFILCILIYFTMEVGRHEKLGRKREWIASSMREYGCHLGKERMEMVMRCSHESETSGGERFFLKWFSYPDRLVLRALLLLEIEMQDPVPCQYDLYPSIICAVLLGLS